MGCAAIYSNGHFGDLSVYSLQFAQETNEWPIGDLYDLALAHLMMLSHAPSSFRTAFAYR
jgi:hypothetical protein